MVDRKIRVFVYETTSADPLCVDATLVSQGRSIRNAMLADLALLDDLVLTCASSGPADADLPPGVQASCRPSDQEPDDYLREAARTHDLAWVVAPETDGLLSRLRRVVPDPQWLGSSSQAIDIASSKQATVRCLQAAGIATPAGIAAPAGIAPGHSSRPGDGARGEERKDGWIVKPDDGCGAIGVRRHADRAAAMADRDARRQRREEAVVERWVEGEPLSITLLCSADGVTVLSLNRQRICVDERGVLAFEGVDIGSVPAHRQERLDILGRQVRQAMPGLRGIVGVDIVWHPAKGPVVIEINPRPTCAYEGLSAMLGRNIAAEMIALHRRAWAGMPPASSGSSAAGAA